MSGGIDANLVVQRWDSQLELSSQYRDTLDGESASAMDLTLLHGRKINFIATNERTPSLLYVADVSKRISVYQLR